MNHKQQIHGFLLLATSTILITNVANGFATIFSKYHLCMMNELSTDTLLLSCDRSIGLVGPDDLLQIPPHGSYNWSFRPTYPVYRGPRSYYCRARWSDSLKGGHVTLFQAFIDRVWFVDGKCEGRHCIWKFAEDGIYLYHIHQGVYEFMYPWGSSVSV